MYFLLISWFSLLGYCAEVELKVDVYVFLHDECIISRFYTLPLNQMQDEFGDMANIIGVFPNPKMDDARIKQFKETYKVNYDLIIDGEYELTNQLGATVTPEVFVVNRDDEKIVYAGRIDNAYARVGKKRPKTTRHELREVLQQIKNEVPITVVAEPAIGCYITQHKLSEE